MKSDPHNVESAEQEAPSSEDAVMRAAVDAYMEATAADQGSDPSGVESDPLAATESESVEELRAALEAARAEAAEQRDQLLRVRADTENLKRRHTSELEKAHKFALDGFVRELLQVRDSLELGHDAALDQAADIGKLREGTELTLKLLGDVMEKFGVVPVEPMEQPFDPEFHQAMSMQPRDDVPPNTVVAVIQKGYTLNGRLVRPALVMVSQQGS
ncbi:nucleotide exchange factor GrpE [Thiorhodococcus mannitoliphagus]|uniref:Protein GrpE n=1 Tax=Thiorhodococcus mannitoliphagus TaxID=329406 RepID=A0A6P1DXT7_9GAMM|nr:nucleotide exchange factor GrpE [Thiorhodococcus mannitoliphagus]NEX22509.1 nucleotide exchange factor GrpE [Thiorhodococcus mannitoliphagus]